jgi:hypothetical protein
LKKLCWNCLKYTLLIVIVISSGFTIYLNHTGSSFDPIKEIQSLRDQNRRDDALDLAKFYDEIPTGNKEIIAAIKNDLEYTITEKIKSISWDGFILGRVYDSYSGIGAISSDLCIYGDIRDLGIQGWKRLTKSDDADGMVALAPPLLVISPCEIIESICLSKRVPPLIQGLFEVSTKLVVDSLSN